MSDADLEISEYLESFSKEKLEQLYSEISGYEMSPVPISEFIHSDNYLGQYFEGNFYSHWDRVLNEIYPSPFYSPYWLISLRGALGLGKCLAKDTGVLMYDGTIKMVQDIVVGDVLMGDDSTPRNVLSLASGEEELFKITPTKGKPYTVNKSHILTLKFSGTGKGKFRGLKTGDVIDYPLDKWILLPDHEKINGLKTFKVGVDAWVKKQVKIDPYFLGLWLGDGTSAATAITTMDNEIVESIYAEATRRGLKVRVVNQEGNRSKVYCIASYHPQRISNTLLDDLKYYNLINNKHIPKDYLVNSLDYRLQLLAGIVDTDGSLFEGGFEIISKYANLAKEIQFLARSCGFYVSELKEKFVTIRGKKCGPYYRMNICGDIDKIPVKIPRKKPKPRRQIKDPLVSGFTAESVGIGEYYGFQIDGNGRFLLDDFTVTHNTTVACAGMAYDLHKLICLSNPQKNYGLIKSTTIVFLLYNVTLQLSQDVGWDKLSQMFAVSPYFSKLTNVFGVKRKHETLFPKRIDFSIGSRIGHSLGKAIYSVLIDEANFSVMEDQVYSTFSGIVRRMETRFMNPGGGVPGKIWVVSSESDKFAVMNKIVDGYKKDKGVYTSQSAIWDVVTHKNGASLYSGNRFKVYTGSETRQAEVITDENSEVLKSEPERVIDVPVELRSSFEFDTNAALRDLAGVSTISSAKYFRLLPKLKAAMAITPIFNDEISVDFSDDTDTIISRCKLPQYFSNPLFPKLFRHIHIDIGVSNDRLGIASSFISGFVERKSSNILTAEEVVETVPSVITEFAFGIKAKPGQQIPLFKVRSFLLALRKLGLPIARITSDSYQSTDMIQQLQREGFKAEILSVDKSMLPYSITRDMVYEGRLIMPINAILLREFRELEINSAGTKIDHPKKNSDGTDGTKDEADGVAGSVYSAIMNEAEAKNMMIITSSAGTNKLSNSNVVRQFWPELT